MLIALRLVLNLFLALLVSLFGSAIVLSSNRRPNAWLWGAVFGAAICLTMMKPVPLQTGWMVDFRVVVVALSGFAGGFATYLTAAAISSLYRLYLGGAGAWPGVAAIFAAGLAGVYFSRLHARKEAMSVSRLFALGGLLALITIFVTWTGSLASAQEGVMTWQLALLLLGLTPLGTVIAFHVFSVVRSRITEQVTIEAAVASIPTALAVLDAQGRVLATNREAADLDVTTLPRVPGTDPMLIAGRKYLVGRQPCSAGGVKHGEFITLDDVTILHDAIEQLRNFFELALDLMVILGPNNEIEQTNRVAAQFGLRSSVRLLDRVQPEDRAQTAAVLRGVRIDGVRDSHFEHRAVREDGAIRWLTWSCVADLPSGHVYAVGRDVTEDRQYLDALRTRTALLKEQSLFLELAYDAVIVRELGGKITFWNSGATRTYGYTREEALGVDYQALLRGTYPLPMEDIEAELASNDEWCGEVERFHKDGKKALVSCHWALQRDEQLFPVAILEVSRDVTEQVRARQTTAHLAALVEQSQDAIISTDLSGRILAANSAAGTLLGCNAHGLVGQSVLLLVQPEHHRSLKQELESVYQEHASRQANLNLRNATGSLVPVSIALSLMPSQRGNAAGISLVLRDLTAKQARDREITRLDRLSLASQLATGIGHEVRNPLTTIRGFLQLFCLRQDLSSYTEQFKLLIGAIDRMNETLTEFLTLARNHPVELVETDVNGVILAALGLLEADARQAACVVRCELQEVPQIVASERAIRQVLVNLVRNSLEASAAGGAVVIRTALIDGHVVLSVSDQGAGIPVEVRAQIGTPFFTTKPEGTGLGLTVCHAIALQHGATLTFDNGNGGTTFYMSFPV
ncbi:MAG: Sporulation kinase E [Firmicutes bacterium]|nr:Sporulation kinase E [candidate division NPL-UPA2 bacterium]